MASTCAYGKVGGSGRFSQHTELSANEVRSFGKAAFLHQRIRTTSIRGQQYSSKRSETRASDLTGGRHSQTGWKTQPLLGRRPAFRGRIGAASEGSDSEGERSVYELKEYHKPAANPYGYAWWKLVLAVLASAAFFYLFNSLEAQMHALQASDLPKITVPDKWPWPRLRSASDLDATFRILGDAGRAVYQRYLTLDTFFPIVYTVLYSQLLGFLVVWSQFWAKLPRQLFPSWTGKLAYAVFPFDLLENAAILYVLLRPGGPAAHSVAAASGYFTWVKFLLVVVNVSFMYMGLLLGVFDFVFKLLRRRYDGLSAVIYSLAQR